MAKMTDREKLLLVNKYIGIDMGNLNEFSFRTLGEFYTEIEVECDFDRMSGTKRARFAEILNSAKPRDQAKIIRGVLERVEPNPDRLETRTEELYAKLLAVADRLDGNAVSSLSPEISSEVVERAIADAETLIERQGATSGVDRLHTALHGYLKAVCKDADIEFEDDATMNGLFKLIQKEHPAFSDLGPRAQDVTSIIRAMGSIMDAMNPIRNRASVAHPNENLLDTPEALLVINAARTILHYLNAKLSEVEA